jgi:glucosamine-6-phosphate deaminase
MRLIIQPDYQSVSQWAAHYVAAKIKAANPTPEKPFVLGCPQDHLHWVCIRH